MGRIRRDHTGRVDCILEEVQCFFVDAVDFLPPGGGAIHVPRVGHMANLAVFQELSASPSAIHSINSNIAYGCLPGHKSTASDALQAYLQAELASKYPTWVHVPKELWPPQWHKDPNCKRPMCLLKKSLYGHPESGGHWERHLTKAVVAIGGKPVLNHPSSFWFAEKKLLLTVYVDDLLLSGPQEFHGEFWTELTGAGIRLGDAEDLDRYLGRDHKYF